MGDDLNFARKFTRTAADGLALLVEMEDPRAAGEASVVIDMMTTVQRGAKRLRARHIYSGAQGVLSALHHETDETLQGRIESLGYLVSHYAQGLSDLDEKSAAKSKTPVEAWSTARDTLNELLPMADLADADVLSRLMRAPVTLEAVQQNKVLRFTKGETSDVRDKTDVAASIEESLAENIAAIDLGALDLTSLETTAEEITAEEITTKETTFTETAPMESAQDLDIRAPTAEPALSVTLESMMRDVIADALSVARLVGRTISLSYDMGNRTISHSQAESLSDRLNKALSQIIRQSLTEDRVGHIDINLAGEQLHIIAGTTAMRVAISPETASKPDVKPLITDETEQGLRAQLHLLMDPRSLHETAS